VSLHSFMCVAECMPSCAMNDWESHCVWNKAILDDKTKFQL